MSKSYRRRIANLMLPYLALITCIAHSLASYAQTSPTPVTAPPQFEVATIRPVDPDKPHSVGINIEPGSRVHIQALTLKGLIAAAFQLSYWQLSGGEDWASKSLYDITALPPDSFRAASPNISHSLFNIEDPNLRLMLQQLLMDRFHLQFHRETKPGRIYLLERRDTKLVLHASDRTPGFSSVGWAEGWTIANTTMSQLAKFAGDYYLHVPVQDQTGLTGAFDYRSPPEAPGPGGGEPAGSFQTMIHDIGLKLEPSKGPVETFIIDHAEKPSAN
jgi:uncharacterized protein (TIGR03435 family)